MKLLFCESCSDVFKLDRQPRSCKCGEVRGRYLEDGHHAEVNGRGYSLAIDNRTLLPALNAIDAGARRAEVVAWVRQHEGAGNERTRIVHDTLSAA